MTLKFLNTKEREKILRLLEEQFGIKNVEGRFIMIGKERIFLYNGGLSKEMMEKISKITNLERAGVYFGKMMPSGNGEKIRLSIEGTQILKEEIRKNAKSLLDEFNSKLSQIKTTESYLENDSGLREEGDGWKTDSDFKDIMLLNAPFVEDDLIIAEKGGWKK